MGFDQSYLTGLFLYLRMLQLSLDRAIAGDWIDFISFLKSQKKPCDVLNSISNLCGYNAIPATVPSFLPSENVTSGVCILEKQEISFICWWLNQTAKLVEQRNYVPNNKEVVDVRYNLAVAEELVRATLDMQDKSMDYVEHFNQNDVLKCKPIEHFVGEDWPNL